MRLHIIARGKIGRSPEAELVERYLKRISWPTKITELPDRGGAIPAAERKSRTVMLDEKGDQLSSQQLAELLGRWRDEGCSEIRFCLGAADGFDDGERAAADRLIAFGKSDLAAPAGPGDARRTTIPGNIDPCQPPLSSRRVTP